MKRVMVLNGPNLGMLGVREPDIYGSMSLEDIASRLSAQAPDTEIDLRQTDSEAEMVTWLHEAYSARTAVLLNAGALTHYSYSLADAVKMCTSAGVPVIEVHITNPHARERFRQHSSISAVCSGVIAGFGADSYALALRALVSDSSA